MLALAACTSPVFTSKDIDGGADSDEPGDDASSETPDEDVTDEVTPSRARAAEAGMVARMSEKDASVETSASPAEVMGGDAAIGAQPAAPDAATPAGDGGMQALPTWAEPLLGRYFKRTVTMSYDDGVGGSPINTRNVEHSLVSIERGSGGDLDVTIQLCGFSITWTNTASPPVYRFEHPTDIPPLRGQLVLAAPGRFSSKKMVQRIGFDPAFGCPGTGRMTKRTEQDWISGTTCRCSPTSIPSTYEDCRVVDTDRDGAAGFTMWGTLPPLPAGLASAVFESSITFKDGQIKSNRQHTLSEERTQSAACLYSFDVQGCSFGNNTLCPGATVTLIPTQLDATCAQLNPAAFEPLSDSPTMDCRDAKI